VGQWLYDPATGAWSVTGNLNAARQWHTATLLPDGQVLVAGGYTGNSPGGSYLLSSELYDPVAGTWAATGDLNVSLAHHQAALLPNGKVLVCGGAGEGPSGEPILPSSGELYDPATKTWELTGQLTIGRALHSVTLLANGWVLAAGGTQDGESAFFSTELYDPASGAWEVTAALNIARFYHAAVLLPDGKVLVTGGGQGPRDQVASYSSAELYESASAANLSISRKIPTFKTGLPLQRMPSASTSRKQIQQTSCSASIRLKPQVSRMRSRCILRIALSL
jgi:N-acetylneuraminic acid mutarotase